MGHGKETPRQKMIGMMYLVLTALLALNVQKEVLNAFVIVDEGMTKMNENYSKKNEEMYFAFDQANAQNPAKSKKWRDIAYTVKQKSEELYENIQDLKLKILSTAGEVEAVKGREINTMLINGKENTDVPAQVMIVEGNGKKLKAMIEDYRRYLIEQIDPKAEALINSLETGLSTKDPEPVGGKTESWESEHFEHLPLAGVLTIMTGLQSNVKNAEADVLRYLYTMIDKGSFKFTSLEATVIANSNYVIQGNEYQAKVFMAAFDTTQDPEIYLGPCDSVRTEEGYVYTEKKGFNYGAPLPVKKGKGIYSVRATAPGEKNLVGIIKLKAPSGGQDIIRPFKTSYRVAEPMLVVSPTKMNVFYLGVDNPVEISVPGVEAEKIFPSISNGTITKSGKSFIVRPSKSGIAQINILAEIDKQKKQMGAKEFRVKIVPDPVAKVAGIKGSGVIDKNVLLAQSGIVAEMENFDFDLQFKVTEFKVSVNVGGFSNDKTSKSNKFTPEQFNLIKGANRGQKVYIEDVKAVGPDGSIRLLGSIALTLK
ncbi:MAG TPA: gliding motility protein GldM [Bacteroidales bacterium]|nr:gliding motility protein GldM [Bacteroidales bacterium]